MTQRDEDARRGLEDLWGSFPRSPEDASPNEYVRVSVESQEGWNGDTNKHTHTSL